MEDSRFTALSRDPRYRLPNRKQSRTTVDPRFKRLFTDQDFRKKATVDKYGRKVKSDSGRKELERAYQLEGRDSKDKRAQIKGNAEKEAVIGSEESSLDDSDEEEEQSFGLKDPAREGGFSESSSSEESSSDEDESDIDNEADIADGTAGYEQTETVPMGEVSSRMAAVNLDWDNIRAIDIMAVASSFTPQGGKVASVVIYPSEFGKERLEREELEGPPREIFASSKKTAEQEHNSDEDEILSDEFEDDEDESDELDDDDDEGEGEQDYEEDDEEDEKIKKRLQQEQVNEGDEFDAGKLRAYQLQRLRYYYAVITCDGKATAKKIYDSMDGREYLATANFFDLRFIPDETSFEDDEPRDECMQVPEGYKPNEFKTQALTHSKVRLTWDDDDTTRKEVQKRAFSRAEMDENDLQAYIGSDSSDAESVASRRSTTVRRNASKRETQKAKMRAAFGLSEEPSKSSKTTKEPMGDMQITFTSGLSSGNDKSTKGVFENEPHVSENTRDRYMRKERERKEKRKEQAKALDLETQAAGGATEVEDAGFDDVFFTNPAASTAAKIRAKKAEKKKELAAQADRTRENEARKAELELLMADHEEDNIRHFDMREIERSAKDAKRIAKKSKLKVTSASNDGSQRHDDFRLETRDPRFTALYDSHEYAIDPSNPRFKSTEGMKALLEEGRNKRKHDSVDTDEKTRSGSKKTSANFNSDKRIEQKELTGLIEKLKRRK